MRDIFTRTFYTALDFETGGIFNPNDPACINGTDRRKCGTSGGPDDRGGNTKFGIAQNSHPRVNIDALTLDQAGQIYKQDYWLASSCDKYPDLVGAYVFDIACGSGPSVANHMLQRAVGVTADGVVGQATLVAVQATPVDTLLNNLKLQRHAYYQSIADHNSSQAKFLPGWFRRADTFLDVLKKY